MCRPRTRTCCIARPHRHAKDQGQKQVIWVVAPEVECISMGEARNLYEFGVKVTLATTLKEGLVVGMLSTSV